MHEKIDIQLGMVTLRITTYDYSVCHELATLTDHMGYSVRLWSHRTAQHKQLVQLATSLHTLESRMRDTYLQLRRCGQQMIEPRETAPISASLFHRQTQLPL